MLYLFVQPLNKPNPDCPIFLKVLKKLKENESLDLPGTFNLIINYYQ